MVAMIIDWTQGKSGGCQAWELWQTSTFSLAEWPVDPPAVLSRGQERRCKGCCDRSPHSPFRNEALIFPTAGTIGYSQPHSSPRLALSQIIPLLRSSHSIYPVGRGQRSGPMGSMGSISEDFCRSRVPHGVAGAIVLTTSVSLLPLSLPSSGFWSLSILPNNLLAYKYPSQSLFLGNPRTEGKADSAAEPRYSEETVSKRHDHVLTENHSEVRSYRQRKVQSSNHFPNTFLTSFEVTRELSPFLLTGKTLRTTLSWVTAWCHIVSPLSAKWLWDHVARTLCPHLSASLWGTGQ